MSDPAYQHRPANIDDPVDAAWEGFVDDLYHDDSSYDATVARHRPLIEAAIRAALRIAPAPETSGLREALEAVLSDEPTLEGGAGGISRRWYSEGWNRCARDVRAVLMAERP